MCDSARRGSQITTWAPAQQARIKATGDSRSVDIHCHLLPGLDDGPSEIAESVELCRWLVDDGITSVIATPHQLGRYDLENTPSVIRQRLTALDDLLHKAEIPLEIVPGADVRIDERLPRLVANGEVLTAGDLGGHLLLELPTSTFCEPRPVIAALLDQGVQSIMTHPERHRYLNGSLEVARSWIRAGAVIQVTAGSLLGDFGRHAYEYGWRLVTAGLVSLVATDAHDPRRRPPRMSAAMDALTKHAGEELTNLLCSKNPLKVWRGEPIPPPDH